MKKALLMTVIVIAAVILGALIGQSCETADTMHFLSYSKEFALSPSTFDIDFLSITFGFHLKMNVAQLILIFVGIGCYCKIAPKLFTSK